VPRAHATLAAIVRMRGSELVTDAKRNSRSRTFFCDRISMSIPLSSRGRAEHPWSCVAQVRIEMTRMFSSLEPSWSVLVDLEDLC
jgi:hypothetical protein